LDEEEKFIKFLIDFSTKQTNKPVLFITADNFLTSVTKNIEEIKKYFYVNTPENQLLSKISNKYEQYLLAKNAGIEVPETVVITKKEDIQTVSGKLMYPLLIKGLDVNSWREKISSSIKGFPVSNKDEFNAKAEEIVEAGVPIVVQEILIGPDTNHFKYCTYLTTSGETKIKFTCQKIRQNPIRFGVGSVMESVGFPELEEAGFKLFTGIGYTGVGSAEFKIDERDGKLKLIEINSRYWQQNALATRCGLNFPLINYLDVTGQNPPILKTFIKNIKWVNIYNDFESFISYKKLKEISFRKWLKSLKGKKIYSDFAKDDFVPTFYEFRFGLRLLRIPLYLFKKIFK
jgi:predicted ATP-grasp superfamily ATP-dependent carboligase